ncbi:hypothetical protein LENED_004311 [Lentinula edodes]|uniref:Uncharacterized protein n=1 Tax=Lentinula edodes TaxID=5353 RepID=A0A1Q3E5X8_LENED|nr:hypothetical protein LENED_004311 [Lentinula edodes]
MAAEFNPLPPFMRAVIFSVYQLHLARLSMMYFYRLISALAFVSMVLAAAVPSPGSPIADAHQPLALPSNGPQLSSENEKTIEVTFSQDSADPKWIQNTQDNVQSGVMEVLRRAWPKYSLQSVKIKDVKFHGFVSGATNHHTFKVKFLEALPTLAGFGECEGWVTPDLDKVK